MLGGLAFVMIAWLGAGATLSAFSRGLFAGTSGIFTFPMWPVYALLTFGCAVTSLQFARFALRCWFGWGSAAIRQGVE